MTDESTIDRDPSTLHAKAWAEEYELIDRQLSPLGLAAMQELQLVRGERGARRRLRYRANTSAVG